MHIVTLGHTTVGKTTYMATLYGEMQSHMSGFRLRSADDSVHEDLQKLSTNIRRGRYPPPTAHRNEYDFGLHFRGNKLLNFNWSDYRGGDLVALSSNEQARRLHDELAQANGLMLLYDGDALAHKAVRHSQLGRMTALIGTVLSRIKVPFSLALVLTKSDMLSEFNGHMLEHFGGIISAIEASDTVSGAFIPVACGHTTMNVALPLFFALQSALDNHASGLLQEISDATQHAAVLDQSNQGFDWLVDQLNVWVNGGTTKDEQIAGHRAAAAKKRQALAPLKSALAQIREEVQRLPHFVPGTSDADYLEQINRLLALKSRSSSAFATSALDPFDAFNW